MGGRSKSSGTRSVQTGGSGGVASLSFGTTVGQLGGRDVVFDSVDFDGTVQVTRANRVYNVPQNQFNADGTLAPTASAAWAIRDNINSVWNQYYDGRTFRRHTRVT